jgi:hypothetical protein
MFVAAPGAEYSEQAKVLAKTLPKSRPSEAPKPGKQQQFRARRAKK